MIIFALLAIVFGVLLASRPEARRPRRATRGPAAAPALDEGDDAGYDDDEDAYGAPADVPPVDEPEIDEAPAEPLPPPAPPRPLRLGESFSRAEIRALLGGSVQENFPHVDGRVVAGCFHPGFHPYAPFVVLPGFTRGIRRWAEAFADQGDAVPCFLKRDDNAWEYVGDFRVAALVDEADEVEEWARIAEREGDVSMVLHLEAAEDAADAADAADATDAE